MRFLVRSLLIAVALWVTAGLVGGIQVSGTGTLVLAALVIGVINAALKPALVILTLPVTILTLGAFYLVLNALLFALAAAITPGFAVSGFWAAFLGALLMSALGVVLHALVPGV